jgi:putative MATE family efflux protein
MSQADNNPTLLLERQSIGKLLLSYSLPAIAGMVIISLYNIIDSIFIGKGVGPMGLTGLAVSFPLMNLELAVCLLTAVGGSALCSIELGRKNMARAQQILGHVILLSLIFGVILSVACLFFLDTILMLFGASPETLPYARDFMQIMLLSAPLFFVMLGLNNLARASGYPKKAMMTSVLSVGVNIVLAPTFIFVLDWGIRGAALATVCAQLASLLWLVAHFLDKKHVLHFVPGIYRLKADIIKPMLSIGLSPFSMNVCACLIVIIMNLALYRHGGDLAIGAFGILNRLMMLFAMTIVGLTHAMQPIIGYNYGAGHPGRVLQTLRYAIIASTVVTTLGCLAAQSSPGTLARMFTDDAELIDLAVNALRIATVTFPLVGSQIVIAAYFQCIGLASVAIVLSLSRQMLFLLPFLLVMPKLYGLKGVWISMPMADSLAFLVSVFLLIWSMKRKHLERGSVGKH